MVAPDETFQAAGEQATYQLRRAKTAPTWEQALGHADLLRSYAATMTYAAVAGARREGASWAAIGEQLGMTRQAAQQRFGAPDFAAKVNGLLADFDPSA